MKVRELIEKLQALPPDAEVWHLWDGEARSVIQHVWLARQGHVVTADSEAVCYSDGSRPPEAPTEAEDPYWSTPKSTA
jgi:hypothetical protein